MVLSPYIVKMLLVCLARLHSYFFKALQREEKILVKKEHIKIVEIRSAANNFISFSCHCRQNQLCSHPGISALEFLLISYPLVLLKLKL